MYGLAFALPFERIGSVDIANITVRPSQVIVIITVIIWLGRGLLLQKFKFRPNPMLVPILLFLAINVLALINTPNLSRAILVLFFTVFTISVALVLPNIVRHPGQINLVTKLLLISCGLVSVFGIYQFLGDLAGLPISLTGLREQYTKAILGFPRIQSTALEPLYFANYLLIPLNVALALLLSKTTRRAGWLIGLIALAGINFVLTVSRGGYIALAVCVVLLSIIYLKELLRPRNIISILLAIVVVAIIATRFININNQWENFSKHVANIFGGASFVERVETFSLAEQIWRAHPWLGIGSGGFGPYAAYHPLILPAEGFKIVNNEYIELLAETGVLGFGCYVLLIIMLLARTLKALKNNTQPKLHAILIGLSLAWLGTLVQYNTFSVLYIMHIWFLIGLIITVQNNLLYAENGVIKK